MNGFSESPGKLYNGEKLLLAAFRNPYRWLRMTFRNSIALVRAGSKIIGIIKKSFCRSSSKAIFFYLRKFYMKVFKTDYKQSYRKY
jgi:hypothetical protein